MFSSHDANIGQFDFCRNHDSAQTLCLNLSLLLQGCCMDEGCRWQTHTSEVIQETGASELEEHL